MTTVDKQACSPLRLVPCRRRLIINAPRVMTQVDPDLVVLFQKLAEGAARWPLYLHGPVGSGKTAAGLAFCDIVETASYFTIDELCDQILEPEAAKVRDAWVDIQSKQLVVLDEIGAREKIGDLHYSAIRRFADARELHAGRRAIYIANLSPRNLADTYDDRITSRVLCGTKFELRGRDRRLDR